MTLGTWCLVMLGLGIGASVYGVFLWEVFKEFGDD